MSYFSRSASNHIRSSQGDLQIQGYKTHLQVSYQENIRYYFYHHCQEQSASYSASYGVSLHERLTQLTITRDPRSPKQIKRALQEHLYKVAVDGPVEFIPIPGVRKLWSVMTESFYYVKFTKQQRANDKNEYNNIDTNGSEEARREKLKIGLRDTCIDAWSKQLADAYCNVIHNEDQFWQLSPMSKTCKQLEERRIQYNKLLAALEIAQDKLTLVQDLVSVIDTDIKRVTSKISQMPSQLDQIEKVVLGGVHKQCGDFCFARPGLFNRFTQKIGETANRFSIFSLNTQSAANTASEAQNTIFSQMKFHE